MGAPRPRHLSIRPNHLDKLACEVCHIPALHRAAGEGFDVTTGAMVNFPKQSGGQEDRRANSPGSRAFKRPEHRAEDLAPVNRSSWR